MRDLDPPPWLVRDIGIFVDQGLKTLDARNLVLFGSEAPLPRDLYEGGSGGPVSTAVHFWAFRLLGPTPEAARFVSISAGIVTVLAALIVVPPQARPWTAALVALDPAFLVFSRSGLLETVWMAMVVAALAATRAGGVGSVLAGALFASAFLTKPTALFTAPALLAAAVMQSSRENRPHPSVRLLGLGIGGACVAGTVFALRPEAAGNVSFLARVGLDAFGNFLEVPGASFGGLWNVLSQNPILYVIAAYAVARFAARRDTLSEEERRAMVLAGAWAVLVLLSLSLLGFGVPPARYTVNLVVPASLMAGTFLGQAVTSRRRYRWKAIVSVALGVLFVWSVHVDAVSWSGRTSLKDAREELQNFVHETVGDGEVIVTGLWAPTLALGTDWPVLASCGGCRFPPPHGTAENAARLRRRWGKEFASSSWLVVVADESAGELEYWRRGIREARVEVAGTEELDMAGHRGVVFAIRSPSPSLGFP